MDKETLVARNRQMTEAFHALPMRHYVRRVMLRMAASLPIRKSRGRGVSRILLIRPDHFGDMLLATAAIRALRRARPLTEIHVLAGPWAAGVLVHYPEVDLVLTLPFPGFERTPKEDLGSPYTLAVQTARKLRRIGYNSAVVLRPDHWWGAMVAHLAGIPERIGYNLPDVAPFLTRRIPFEHTHTIVQNLRLIERWTGKIDAAHTPYYFAFDGEDQRHIDSRLHQAGVPAERAIFCIHPGSGAWVKLWQEEKWASVADTLSDQLDAAVIFTGTDAEMPLIRRITMLMKQPYVILAGETNTGQLAALYARAKVVLGPDSGPLHLAAAVDTPTVALFGPADPAEFRPWGSAEKHFVVTMDIGCRPCRVLDWADDNPEYHPCVRGIAVGEVLDAARRAASQKTAKNSRLNGDTSSQSGIIT